MNKVKYEGEVLKICFPFCFICILHFMVAGLTDGWMDGVVVHIVLLLLTISFVENNNNHVCQQ